MIWSFNDYERFFIDLSYDYVWGDGFYDDDNFYDDSRGFLYKFIVWGLLVLVSKCEGIRIGYGVLLLLILLLLLVLLLLLLLLLVLLLLLLLLLVTLVPDTSLPLALLDT